MKVLEWSQKISHCKLMQFFYDDQGQLTPQSEVGSTFQVFMVVLVTCKNEEDPLKMKVLEWSQHNPSIFLDAQGELTP